MKPLLISIFSNKEFTNKICNQLPAEEAKITLRQFPDHETYFQLQTPCKNRNIIVLADLHNPNIKIAPLIFISETLKDLGAKNIGLVSPYLPYMRQDKRFKDGEAITSKYFAKFISSHFDFLVTVDPHLHRYNSLNEIYSIPSKVVHAAPAVSQWIKQHIKSPLLIGPDIESEQWVSEIARNSKIPHIILNKIRHDDYNVEISLPDIKKWKNHTPVLVDDIISTGQTMIETIHHLKTLKLAPPICIGVHGLFSNDAYKKLIDAGANEVITCNSIFHNSNQIDLSSLIVDAIKSI